MSTRRSISAAFSDMLPLAVVLALGALQFGWPFLPELGVAAAGLNLIALAVTGVLVSGEHTYTTGQSEDAHYPAARGARSGNSAA